MIRVGVTGGIGSGKSTVAKVFETLGAPVYNSDQRAKSLMEKDFHLKSQITTLFGSETYRGDGSLNREYLASIVFNKPERLKQLNDCVHPAVKLDFENWCSNQNAPYIIKEAAILIESGAHIGLDVIVLVVAPKDSRVKRVVLRDSATELEVLSRMEKQWPDEEKMPYADYIVNNEDSSQVLAQLVSIHKELLIDKF